MTESYSIKKRENPFQFHASEFLGDIPNLDLLPTLKADVGALVYVVNIGYTYIQARPGDWKQLKAGRGTTGAQGPTGPEGAPGVDGKDGCDGIDGKDGRDGSDGRMGRQGEQGKPGPTGPRGLPGVDGKDGVDGRDGLAGTNGAPGAPGREGPRGLTGTNGEDGRGWSSGEYDHVTGTVTFKSDDGLGFQTGDLRGAPSPWAHMSLQQLADALKPYL